MRDPEMCFELSRILVWGLSLDPFYFRNDYMGIEQWSRFLRDGQHVVHAELHPQHESFAALWDPNLIAQGFVEASDRQQKQQ